MHPWESASTSCRASADPWISGYGDPTYLAEAASASYSREREIAIWISMAAIGARIIMAMAPIMPPPRLSSSRLPPNQKAIRARKVMAAASVAATELIRISRCSTCPSSCATTPSISLSFISCRMPAGERHRSVLRVAAGGEGVGRRFGDEVQLRHRQVHALSQALHDGRYPAVDFRVLGLGERLRASTSRARSYRRRNNCRSS